MKKNKSHKHILDQLLTELQNDKKLAYSQLVLVEFNNAGPWIEKFVSDKPITIQAVADYYVEKEGFDEDRDSITFVSEPGEVIKL